MALSQDPWESQTNAYLLKWAHFLMLCNHILSSSISLRSLSLAPSVICLHQLLLKINSNACVWNDNCHARSKCKPTVTSPIGLWTFLSHKSGIINVVMSDFWSQKWPHLDECVALLHRPRRDRRLWRIFWVIIQFVFRFCYLYVNSEDAVITVIILGTFLHFSRTITFFISQ